MRASNIVAWAIVGLVLVFLFAPIIVVIVFAFNGTSSVATMQGFGVGAFRTIIHDPTFLRCLQNSLKAAAATCVIGGFAGVMAALGLARLPRRLTGMISSSLAVPLCFPGLFLGMALLGFYSKMHVSMSLVTVVMGHTVITLPLIILIVAARLDRLDLSVVEAARDLGAGPLLAFRRIFFPMLAPAIIGSVLLTLATSLDEFIITMFVKGDSATVPIYIFSQMRFGLTTEVNAIAVVMLTITVGVSAMAARFISVQDVA